MRGSPARADLWGKLIDNSVGGPAWHPLVDHCLDVAAVLETLLQQPTLRRRLAQSAGRAELDATTIARLTFLAFIHDLGKCAAGFQAKARPESGGTIGHLAALRPLWCEGELWPHFAKLLADNGLAEWGDDVLQDYLEGVLAHDVKTPYLV